MPMCGEFGFIAKKTGKPCQQATFDQEHPEEGCIWHSERHKAKAEAWRKEGSDTPSSVRLLPLRVSLPKFDSREDVMRYAQILGRKVLTTAVDPRRVDVALRAAQVALSGFAQQTQEKLVDALLRVEHGGAAVVLLERLTAGMATGRRRELPGRRRTMDPRGESGEVEVEESAG